MNDTINYKAVNKSGENINSSFHGNLEDFKTFVKQKELVLISYKIKKRTTKKGTYKNKHFLYFIEELLYLIRSGMSLDKSLAIIKNSTNTEIELNYYENILIYLKEGNQLSESIKLASKKFNIQIDDLSIILLETNESVGNLSLGLKKVKEHLEYKEKIFSDIKQAISYPIFLIIMSISMIFFVFLIIVPKFSSIFTPEEFENLPFLSKVILEIGLYVDSNINFILLIIFSIIPISYFYKNKLKDILYALIIQIPLFKEINLKLELSYFFASLSLMLEGGLDIKKALFQSKKIIKYPYLLNLINSSYENIKQGINISDTFKNSDLISSSTISLITAGENSGNLEEVFTSLAKRNSQEFDKAIKTFLSILEPLVIVLMGLVIAVIVISIMLAVMSITDIAG